MHRVNRKTAFRGGFAALALAAFAAAAPAAVIEIVPTGTPADVTNIAAALAAAVDGDIILLRARDAVGEYETFDLSSMTSSEFVVSAPNVTVSGEADLQSRRVRTNVLGPTTYDADGSFVAFDVQGSADGFMVSGVEFRRFEAALLLREGAKNVSMVDCTLINCANGVFGLGDNDGLTVEGTSIRVSATPTGGNAAVTVQEGSDDVRVSSCNLIGPGLDKAAVAAAGIIDFNLDAPAARLAAFGNTIQRFDVGIYLSGASPRLARNTVTKCGDGVAAVSEISTGSTPGSQTVSNAFIRSNSSRLNADDGIHLVGVTAALVAFNQLSPNIGAGLVCEAAGPSSPTIGVTTEGNSGSQSCGGSLTTGEAAPRRSVRPAKP